MDIRLIHKIARITLGVLRAVVSGMSLTPKRYHLLVSSRMFKKHFNMKTASALRGFDRRKLKASVASNFQLESCACGVPLECSVDLLLPEGLKSAKYTASAGINGVNTPVSLSGYCNPDKFSICDLMLVARF